MSALRHIAVIDIGKTNAKVALVDLTTLSEVALRRMANAPVRQPPYPHHDVEALWTFILNSLASLNREHRIDAISITTHGATGVLVDTAGELVLPVLDYEFDGPDRLAAEYEAIRPPFTETGTPRLPQISGQGPPPSPLRGGPTGARDDRPDPDPCRRDHGCAELPEADAGAAPFAAI